MASDRFDYFNDYNRKNYDRVTIMVPKGEREKWKALAQQEGISLAELIRRAVADYFEKMQL